MATSLQGKTALVTGAGRGIGRAIASELASEGVLVAVHYGHAKEGAEETVKQIETAGGQAFALSADLGSIRDLPGLFERLDAGLRERAGHTKLDILVCNAGRGGGELLEEATEENFDQTFAVNVKAPYFICKHASPRLNDGGRIVLISSNTAESVLANLMVYAASKNAVNSFARTMGQHFGPRGITVNAIMPGITETDMTAKYLADPQASAFFIGKVAMGRVGQPIDVARAVVMLASPQAAWVTGQIIEASGGMRL